VSQTRIVVMRNYRRRRRATGAPGCAAGRSASWHDGRVLLDGGGWGEIFIRNFARRPGEASYTNNVEFVGRGGQRRKRGESAPWLNWPKSPPNVFHPPSHWDLTRGERLVPVAGGGPRG